MKRKCGCGGTIRAHYYVEFRCDGCGDVNHNPLIRRPRGNTGWVDEQQQEIDRLKDERAALSAAVVKGAEKVRMLEYRVENLEAIIRELVAAGGSVIEYDRAWWREYYKGPGCFVASGSSSNALIGITFDELHALAGLLDKAKEAVK